jgi:hypothetical protein
MQIKLHTYSVSFVKDALHIRVFPEAGSTSPVFAKLAAHPRQHIHVQL